MRIAIGFAVALAASGVLASAAVGFDPVPGSPFLTAVPPGTVAFSPDGRFLAGAASQYEAGLQVLTVDHAGAVAEAPGSPNTPGGGVKSVAFSPDGRLLAVALQDNGVGVFSVDQATGALSPVPGSPFADPLFPDAVAFSPDGGTLAVANELAPGLSMFSVDRTTGALAELPGSPVQVPLAYSVLFSPDGRLLALAISPTGVLMFRVGQDAGSLSEVAGSPFEVGLPPAEVSPHAIAFSPDGTLFAVASLAVENTVSVFSVDQATGALHDVRGSPFADEPGAVTYHPAGPASVAFSPSGDLLATANMDFTASVFLVDRATGALRQVSGSPFGAAAHPSAIAFSPDGAFLLVTGDLGITVFSTAVDPPSVRVNSPANGARYAQRQRVTASYTCTDGSGGSGLAACTGTLPNGAPINTATRGRHTFTVTARSRDGQVRAQTATYTVGPPSNRFTISDVQIHTDGRITFSVRVPGPGTVDVLETAWDDNLATSAALLRPAPRRFAFARAQTVTRAQSVLHLTVRPKGRGRQLVRHPRYRVTLRLWVTYTPTGGRSRSIGLYGRRIPAGARPADMGSARARSAR